GGSSASCSVDVDSSQSTARKRCAYSCRQPSTATYRHMRAAAANDPVTADAFGAMFEQVFESDEPTDAALSISIMQSPVGTLMLPASDSALCSLEFVDAQSIESQLRSLRRQHTGKYALRTNALIDRARSQLDAYFAGRLRSFDVPLSYAGTPFQKRVWAALCEFEYGRTWSYLQLAQRVGDVGATRAVGLANGANPIAILIPCHRVV